MTPKRMPAWRRYLRFWGSNPPGDVDDELRFHLEMRVAEYIARGMLPDAARQRAAQRFGSVDRAREECAVIDEAHARSEGRAETMQGIRQDVAFSLRLLKRQALPSVVAALCLALGIGATTTMFSVGHTLLRRPLPFPKGDRVVTLASERKSSRTLVTIASYPDFVDWRARSRSFEEMAAIRQGSFSFVLSTPVRGSGGEVSAHFFQTFGITPEAGRLFTDDDAQVGAPKVIVVSHSFAETRLGGAAQVVGKELVVGGEKRVVVGVIADAARYPSSGQAWAPLQKDYARESRGNRSYEVFGLLREGMTIDAARRELAAVSEQIAKEHPDQDAYAGGMLTPLRERFIGSSRSGLLALSAATILVLLVACTNVAALQVARAQTRAREIAVRSAIGAGRSRIVRQLLTESVMLSLAGGVLGVGVAVGGMRYVARSIAAQAPGWMTFGVDTRALLFTLVVSMLVGIAFGLAPALKLSRVDPNAVLRAGATGILGLARGLTQRVFVATEIALSIVLVIGALLAIESVVRLQRVPLGIDPTGVVSFRITLQGPRYDSAPERAGVIRDFERRIAAIPRVEGVGATTYVPIVGCCSQFGVQVQGRETEPSHSLMVTGNIVTPGFFHSVRIPLLQGREFIDGDNAAAPKVVIINETFAKRFWPAGDAIGHIIDSGDGLERIIGVVGDIKQARITDGPEPQFYRAHAQDPWEGMTFTARVRGDNAEHILPDVRRAMRDLDANLPVYGVQTLERILADVVDSHRVFGILFAAFALVALILATAGVYATMSFFVSQRTRELGVRVALGAESGRVVGYVMRQGAVLAIVGAVVGATGGIAAARVLAHSLYGVSASEPTRYAVAVSTLVLAAVLASYGPARRASGVDPMIALRSE